MHSENNPNTNMDPMWLRIIKFFQHPNLEYSNIYLAFSANDIKKAKRIEWLFLLIFHSLFCALIPILIISLSIFIPNSGFVFYSGEIGEGIVIFYVFALIYTLLGLYWTGIIDKYIPGLNKADKHLGRILVCYFPPIGLAFTLGLIGAKWIVIAPLFILAAIELIVTFPTHQKWEEWLNDLEDID